MPPLDLTPPPFRGVGMRRPGPGEQGWTPPQAVIFPPEVYPIPGAVLFAPSAQNVAVTNAAVVVLATTLIPAQSRCVVRRVQFGLDSMTTATVITWNLLGNQGPLLPNSFRLDPARAAAFAGDDQELLLRVPDGVTVLELAVTVGAADAATYQVGGLFSGWYWTPEQEAAYRAGVA